MHQGLFAGALAVALLVQTTIPTSAADTGNRIARADQEQANWLTTGRTYDESRESPLSLINDGTIGRLGLAWSYDLDTDRGQESTPLAVDGVL